MLPIWAQAANFGDGVASHKTPIMLLQEITRMTCLILTAGDAGAQDVEPGTLGPRTWDLGRGTADLGLGPGTWVVGPAGRNWQLALGSWD